MAINTYSCECGFKEEYIESFSVEKSNWHPEICPKCNKNPLTKVFDMAGHSIGIDFVGSGFYINDYGIHNWKRNMNQTNQSKVLAGEMSPY